MELSFEQKFHSNVVNLCKVIRTSVMEAKEAGISIIDPLMLGFGISYIEQMSPKSLIETFIRQSFPHWEKIRSRDEKFFLEHASSLFNLGQFDVGKVFRMMMTSSYPDGVMVVPSGTRDFIWRLLTGMVKLSIKYAIATPGMKGPVTEESVVKSWLN